ncbi:TRAP transporter large permease subunit [Pigmentiphaga aceris]|uniref:TRAP transporter large permease subunit n=1 Tax=Pigmentiphaga aceris TaxID=1940612 RepID=A0A5C0AT94_9BURK|nr:TRAP transporter large permease subunit [Pigmentiphaga aceris]QEI05552.1 TRAP transporter large permease subunit [Pigmentiphaga aceris]
MHLADASVQPGNPVGTGGFLAAADRALGLLVEIPAALLVLAEIALLLASVIARYVFHTPLVWGDELASMMFLWLSMLGAVVALRRGEHMRMTALLSRVSPQARAFIDVLTIAASIAFMFMVFPHALEYAEEEAVVSTAALEISNAWRASAWPVGMGLMLLTGVLRLTRVATLKQAVSSLALVALIVGVFYLASPILMTLGKVNLIIFFVGVVAVNVFLGVPIAFGFALATFGYLALTTHTPLVVMVGRMDEGMSHMILLAVPMFIFLGMLIEMTGMARAMIGFLASLLGHVRGGLSYVLIGAMYLVSGISGSKIADMAAVAPALFPEMQKRGSKPGDLAALLSATGAQTETIPPSIVLITIGSVTGVSIAALFTGGLLPAAALGLVLGFIVWRRSRKQDLQGLVRATRKEILRTLWIALPAIVLPFLIRAAVVEGVATATEVSTIGIAYSVIAGLLLYRQFDWSRLPKMLVDTATLSGAIIFIVGAATAMAWGLTQSGFSRDLAALMTQIPGGTVGFLLVSIVAFAILGSVLEGIPAIVLFGPLLFPIAHAVGVHEVHYAMVVILAMSLGLFAPPFGVGFYGACAISKVDPDEAIPYMWGYLVALAIGTVIIALVPWISIGFL